MNCPSCNASCGDDQSVCYRCGTPLTTNPQSNYQQQYSYNPTPVQVNNPDSGLAMGLGITSLVCTLFSCLCGCLGSIPGLICGIIGLVISIRCRKATTVSGASDSKATTGMVTSIIALCLCGLSCIGSLITVGMTFFEELL